MTKTKSKRTAADTVTLPRSEYERLLAKAGEDVVGEGPALPKPDARGNFAAVDFLRASIGRELVRRRHAAGLSQTQLADLANVRQETISRIESGKHTVLASTMQRLERVLESREKRQAAAHPRRASASRNGR